VRRATACVLLLVLALAGGCGGEGSKRDDAAAAAARARARAARQARLVAAGKPVFVKHCASCHTIEGRTAHPTFIESPIPNLDEVKPKEDYVAERADVGGIDMPSLKGEMSQAQFDAVVAYVAGVAGSRVAEPDADAQQLAAGEQVFRGNCQSCHSIDGRSRTGRPTFPGTDFNRVKPGEQLVMRQILRGIPEEMPSFRGRLSRAQLHAVAAYVTATAGE
jgi:cbb3-type cytochrome c oxidase subunit III